MKRRALRALDGKPVGKIPSNVLARAKEGTISLAEAASLLRFNGESFSFASFRDKEEAFIDVAIRRAESITGKQVGGYSFGAGPV